MSLDKEQTLEKIIDYAKKKGASGSDVILDMSSSLSFSAQQGKLDQYNVASSQIVGIRVIKNNRAGVSFSESFNEESLNYMVDQAIANAAHAKEDKNEQISLKDSSAKECSMVAEEKEIDIKEKVNFAISLERETIARGAEVKSSPYNGLAEIFNHRYLYNSNGSYAHHQIKSYYCYAAALLEKDGANSTHSKFFCANNFASLDKKFVIDTAYNFSKDLLTAKAIKTGRYNIVFDTEVLSSLFNIFIGMFSAKAAINDLNPMKKKLGKKIAPTILNIFDRPLYKAGLNHRTFDDEGYPTQEVHLIQNGTLENFLHNSATAKAMATQNTFSARRSPTSSLGVTHSNLFIEKGNRSEKDLFSGIIFKIFNLDGLHSGSDFISGDFSCSASGYLLEDGIKIQTVKGVTISGNFYQMLMEIEGISDTILSDDDITFFSPLIRFPPQTIAGV